jgi:nicotinate-nucleotide adenylyltransferase
MKKIKIGLFFGSFNPVHNGHLIIAKHISQFTDLDEVWLVVSPQNPFKQAATLLNENHRYFLIQAALENEKNLKASNIEFKLPKPSYTADTLVYLKEKFSESEFVIIVGSDSYQNIEKWKNANFILDNFQIYIYNRPNFQLNKTVNKNHKIIDAPLIEISSSKIRKYIHDGKSIRYLVPDIVKEEIEKNLYYRSSLENPA